MGDDGHHVEVVVVQQVESAEREQQRSDERGHVAELEPAQEAPHAGKCERIADDQFEVEAHTQRKGAIEQLVERVEETALPFAVQVEPREDRRRPQHRVAGLQRVLIEVAKREVEPGQIVVDEDVARQQRKQERRQQRDTAGHDEAGERA